MPVPIHFPARSRQAIAVPAAPGTHSVVADTQLPIGSSVHRRHRETGWCLGIHHFAGRLEPRWRFETAMDLGAAVTAEIVNHHVVAALRNQASLPGFINLIERTLPL